MSTRAFHKGLHVSIATFALFALLVTSVPARRAYANLPGTSARLAVKAPALQIAAWAPNTAYAVGVQVTYQGSVYQCRQAHTSQVGWEPPNVPALWLFVGGGDTQPPTAPTNLRSTGTTSTSVSLAWNASTDNVGVTGYDVLRGTTLAGSPTSTSFTVTGLAPNTSYTFTVKAKDAAGNLSAASNAVTVTTQSGGDTQPPTAPTNLRSTGTTSSSVSLAWNASTDNVGVTGYDLFQGTNPTAVGTTGSTSFTVTGLSPSTTYSFTVKAKDAAGNISPASNSVSATTQGGCVSGDRKIVGYWHNFENGSGFIKLREVSNDFDVINVAFAEPAAGSTSNMQFIPDVRTSPDEVRSDISILKGRGKKVLISIGGANGRVQLNTATDRQNFISSMISIIETYGFDGMDIDFEGNSLFLNSDDTDFRTPTTPVITNLISAIRTIRDRFGSSFILTMAPETFFVQVGYSFYGSGPFGGDNRRGAYLPVIHALRDILTYIYVQHYNSGSVTALDDQAYPMGNADFHVAMAEMLLVGFPVARDPNKFFPALRQDQVLIGLPASPQAGNGFTNVAEVQRALDYLVKGISFGGSYRLRNPSGYPNFKGLMTWSINWDRFNNFEFSRSHRAYLNSLPGGGGGCDTQPPTAPTNLRTTGTTSTSVSLAWNASTDNVGVTGYDLFDGNNLVAGTTATSFTVTGLAPSSTHTYTVKAKDAAGNLSAASNAVTVTTQSGGDTQPPTAPSNLRVTGTTSSSVSLAWDASTDNVGVTGYDVFQGSSLVNSTSSTSFTVTGLSPSTTYTFTVRAKDAAGNVSAASNAVSATTQTGSGCQAPAWAPNTAYTVGVRVTYQNNIYECRQNHTSLVGWEPPNTPALWLLTGGCSGDTQPPSAPTNLRSTGTTSTSVSLAWNASTDNVGVTGYDIFRGTTLAGSPTSTSFTVTGLAPNTSYTFTVKAKDAAGNLSAASNALTVTTQSGGDTQPPTAPTNLRSTGTTSSSVSLAWNASTDNVGVTGYDIFQGTNPTAVGTTGSTSFTVTGLSPSTTYSFTVKAKDAAGNISPASNSVSATTQSGGNNQLPKRIIVGYWHNFDNGSGFIKLRDVSTDFDVVNLAFGEPVPGSLSNIQFVPDVRTSVSEIQSDVQILHGRGKKVLLSIGGANGHVELPTETDRQNFINSVSNIITQYGLDGMDIDFEGSSVTLNGGDTDFRNPTTPKIRNLISAVRAIADRFGPNFILSMAPETFFVQVGFETYGGSAGAYLPVIHGLRDKLTYIHVQHYNTGTIRALDGVAYAAGTADFHVAMAEMLLQGFPVAGNQNMFFPALREDQVAIGLPASTQAASSGYTPPAEVQRALNYLIRGTSFGGRYVLRKPSGYPNFRCLMTWSVNWDRFNNFEFSRNHRAFLNGLP